MATCSMMSLRAANLSASATTVFLLLLMRTRNTSTPASIAATAVPSATRHIRMVWSRDPDTASSLSLDRAQHHTYTRRVSSVNVGDMRCDHDKVLYKSMSTLPYLTALYIVTLLKLQTAFQWRQHCENKV